MIMNGQERKEPVGYNVTDPARLARERKYFSILVATAIGFIIFVVGMYAASPLETRVLGVPLVAVLCWSIIVLHYLLFIVWGGAWVLGLRSRDNSHT